MAGVRLEGGIDLLEDESAYVNGFRARCSPPQRASMEG
jgi:hypothetical protein